MPNDLKALGQKLAVAMQSQPVAGVPGAPPVKTIVPPGQPTPAPAAPAGAVPPAGMTPPAGAAPAGGAPMGAPQPQAGAAGLLQQPTGAVPRMPTAQDLAQKMGSVDDISERVHAERMHKRANDLMRRTVLTAIRPFLFR